MYVVTVTYRNYEDTWFQVVGVYSTKEKAEKVKISQEKIYCENSDCWVEIEEIEVDAEPA